MPHLAGLAWDHASRLWHVEKNANEDVYFAYDAAGNRVRKSYVHGAYVEERLYLGGYEVYRKRKFSDGSTEVERQSLHVADDAKRIALVETKTIEGSTAIANPTTNHRYQLDNHLGSALMELDDDAGVISYEEYFPFGGTAWHAGDYAVDVERKRYRYNGKERDEETGLYYYGARYYAAWLGRWTSPDPSGFVDGTVLYAYVRNRPQVLVDPDGRNALAAGILKRSLERKHGSQKQLHEVLDQRKAAAERGDAAAALAAQQEGSRITQQSVREAQKQSTLELAMTSGLLLGPSAFGFGSTAYAGATTYAITHPATTAAGIGTGSVAWGVLDPHPPGGSPLDIPLNPLDDVGRTGKQVVKQALGKIFEKGGDEAAEAVSTVLSKSGSEAGSLSGSSVTGAAEAAADLAAGAGKYLEGAVDHVVRRATGEIITDIDRISRGVLWEEKSATGIFGEGASWIAKHITGKFEKYMEARALIPGYENAPIGFKFTDAAITPEFKASVEAAVNELRKANPGVQILLQWADQ